MKTPGFIYRKPTPECAPRMGRRAATDSSASVPEREARVRRLLFFSPLPGRWIRGAAALLAGLGLLVLAPAAFAANEHDAFMAANAAFDHGRFAEAARGFESVIGRDGYSGPVLFNLANALFLDGQTGRAILNYERALAVAPNDPDIAANLKLAREKAGLPIGELSRISRFTHRLSLNGWAWIAAVALSMGCAAVLLSYVWPRRRAVLIGLGVASAATLLVAAAVLTSRVTELDRAVVTARNCVARIAPVTVAEPLFNLTEGEAVKIDQTRGSFALIETRDGRRGWVKRDEVGQVLAAAGGGWFRA